MGSHAAITIFSPAFWIAITVTLFFIALLTYVYSGKNIKLTAMFTFLSAVVVSCAAGYDTWNYYLKQHFLAGIDQLGVPFHASRSGWFLLIDAWPLWVIPSLILVVITGLALWYLQKSIYKSTLVLATATTDKPKRRVLGLSSETVAYQLELDTLKKALSTANQQLNQAIYDKSTFQVKVKELRAQLKQYEQEDSANTLATDDELKALRLEVSAKAEQIEQSALRITEQDEEINRLKALLEGLLNKI